MSDRVFAKVKNIGQPSDDVWIRLVDQPGWRHCVGAIQLGPMARLLFESPAGLFSDVLNVETQIEMRRNPSETPVPCS